MPTCVFKLLWDTLDEGQEIFAYVLNMAKNGDHYCQMTVDNLEASAKAFSFRRSLPGESLEAYRAALVAHVDRQDMAAAHEIRVGRQQRDWTQADIEAFTQHTATLPGPSSTLHQQAFVTRIEEGPFEVSEQGLRKVALQGVENMIAMRRKEPTTNLMVMASVLLVNGKILTAFVHSEDRLSFVKSMAQTEPVYGYFIVFDGWSTLQVGKRRRQRWTASSAMSGRGMSGIQSSGPTMPGMARPCSTPRSLTSSRWTSAMTPTPRFSSLSQRLVASSSHFPAFIGSEP